MRDFRIIETDEIKEKYYPIIAFFNAIPDTAYIRTIGDIAKGVGSSFNDVHCEFPEDLDSEEEIFDGIRFALINEEIVVNYKILFYFLRKASETYAEDNPQDKIKVDYILEELSNKYEII